MQKGTIRSAWVAGIVSLSAPCILDPAMANVADFYKGNTVTFICATSASGDYALYSQVVRRHLAGHIPGEPQINIQFMPGAGGVRAANYVYNVAAKDGSVIGMPLSSIALNQVLRPGTVRFDAAQFTWIGVVASLPDVIAVWHTAPVKTLVDAKKVQLNMAATGTSSQNYMEPRLANALLGTKFNMIRGYKGSGEMDTAIESGEVHGRMITWQTWTVLKPEWIGDRKVIPLLQVGSRKIPELPNVPAFIDLVKDPEEKAMVELLHATTTISRSVYGPPGIPTDRVKALRDALVKTMADPAFIAETQKHNMAVTPASGEELVASIAKLLATPEKTVERFKKEAGFGE